jgi:hypothetical protein
LSVIGNLTAYGRFAVGLRRFLNEKATAELGRETISQRLRDRDSNFLTLAKRSVYESDRSPYLALLRMAGCEYGDLEHMVRSDGVESALRSLRDAGVYVTIEEFKCRQDIVRGNTVVHCQPRDFDNPFLMQSITTGSSGSRGPGVRTTMNLERLQYNAMCQAVVSSAHKLHGKPTLLWVEILPSAAGLAALLQACKMGAPPLRWFSPVAQQAIKPDLSKRLATLYAVYAGRLFGTKMPAPEYVSGERIHVVAEYVDEVARRGAGVIVYTSPSAAVRLCRLASANRHDFTGVTFRVVGEPLTNAKMEEISSVGAGAVNVYAFAEGGVVGYGCAGSKDSADDIHVLSTSIAVIQHRRDAPFGGGVIDAFLFTSLSDKTPKILLNVESGDYGVLETRDCGCELGECGLTQHLHTIRSFEKLTGEGMSFVGTDILRIIEEVLPSKLGGVSTDYQIVEYEDAAGLTRLDVVVSPAIGEVDDGEIVSLVLAELARGGDTNRMMAEVWRQGKILRVRREAPYITPAGKQLSLHILRQPKA